MMNWCMTNKRCGSFYSSDIYTSSSWGHLTMSPLSFISFEWVSFFFLPLSSEPVAPAALHLLPLLPSNGTDMVEVKRGQTQAEGKVRARLTVKTRKYLNFVAASRLGLFLFIFSPSSPSSPHPPRPPSPQLSLCLSMWELTVNSPTLWWFSSMKYSDLQRTHN